MSNWKIAGVQMDCAFADTEKNLANMLGRLHQAAAQQAKLIVFPECILSGYGYESLAEAMPHAQEIPGPACAEIGKACEQLGVWVVFGLLEKAGDRIFNSCALIGPSGLVGSYRKIHLPYLGIDRFATKGDRPFAVNDLGGLRIGINICYDGSFPESARVMTLQGADLILLPTNWPLGSTAQDLVRCRTLENNIFYCAVNRVGEERGFRFIGQSQIVDCSGKELARGGEGEEILYAEIDPERARKKRVVRIPGKYEIDRVGDRRPEMYKLLAEGG